ncbi:phytanoyl-CoA dioxygenase family protein, partial [Paenibacillus sepulcri]|nr:phytanoyl-CoA dioxygenase family protein [Paenibacillus sepulcri]
MSINLANSKKTREDKYPSRISDKPAIVERADPVVYSTWKSGSPLTQEQFRFYDRNGYLFLDQFFSGEEVADWRSELKKLQQHYGQREAEH